ncbi:MAG TPA: TetR-like C-terminal domain-containing protein [Anaerolineales bacterium]|nr:TetR-like C-terminal domain-containing protein [Anaerolineales bacterium]
MLLMYRQWAVDHPVEYALIYSKPIPDYQPPADVIDPAVQRIPTVVIGFMIPLWQQGLLRVLPDYDILPAELKQNFAALREATGYSLPVELLHNVLIIWSRLHGLIMLEIFGHLHQSIHALDVLYRFEVSTILKNIGLQPEG